MPSPAPDAPVQPDAPAVAGPRPLRILFFLDYTDSLGGCFANSPGLLPLIGLTRARGFDIDFVGSEPLLLERLATETVDVVAISSMERLLPRTAVVARRVRAAAPSVVLMIGGNALDPFAADLAASLFDVVVLGEAEHIFPALLEAVAAAKVGAPKAHDLPFIDGPVARVCDADDVPGCDATISAAMRAAAFVRDVAPGVRARVRIGGTLVRDPASRTVWQLDEPRFADAAAAGVLSLPGVGAQLELGSPPLASELDTLCIEPWDIFRREGWTHFEFYAQRGCRWGRCSFCSVSDRQVRAQSPQKVLEVIRAAVANGAELVSFADDLFLQHKAWNVAVLEAIAEAGFSGIEFRAQTMATATVWPMLDLMKRAGFAELAFGVETLSPERAEFMKKTLNGPKYVANAKETVLRTAQAGIHPVLYIIMVDPRSTLHEIATELVDTVLLCRDVFRDSGILPKISYSLMMLPVASTAITDSFPYFTEPVSLGSRTVTMPSEFKVRPEVARYLAAISRRTDAMPKRRENLSGLEAYLEELSAIAAEFALPEARAIAALADRGLTLLAQLTADIDGEIDHAAASIARYLAGDTAQAAALGRLDHRWLGGYVRGVETFFQSIRHIEAA